MKHEYEPVPEKVFKAACDAVNSFEEEHRSEYQFLREFLTAKVQSTRSAEGWVFDTNYRHEVDEPHALIYSLISTVAANSDTPKQVADFFGKV